MKTLAWIIEVVTGVALIGCVFDVHYSVGGTLSGLSGTGLVLEDKPGGVTVWRRE